MSAAAPAPETLARDLAGRHFDHPMISAFLDLDPTRFATARARATEINSLMDGAVRQLNAAPLDHADRSALKQGAVRIDAYLHRELDASGMNGIAIYCSQQADLFEVTPVSRPVQTAFVLEPIPRLEPLLAAPEPVRVAVALVNRRETRIFTSTGDDALREQDSFQDQVHGQHHQGGWSEPRYERSIENDVDVHLRRTAERLYRLWQDEPYDRLVLGGPHELIARFVPLLHNDLQRFYDGAELTADLSASSTAEIQRALAALRQQWCVAEEAQVLRGLLSKPGDARRGATGFAATLAALGQRQVKTLVLEPHIDAAGGLCQTCELIYASSEDSCPADGSRLIPLPSLRSGMVRSAVRQDAHVVVLHELEQDAPEPAAFGGVGALLRY